MKRRRSARSTERVNCVRGVSSPPFCEHSPLLYKLAEPIARNPTRLVGGQWFDRRMRMFGSEWIQSIDRFGKVGSKHHVIPRFLLQRWADPRDQVWSKSKHDRREGLRNIRDLGIKDFYTFLADDGQLDSSMEEALSVIEQQGAAVLKRLNNPYDASCVLTPGEFADLTLFVAVQIVRGPRQRREHELMADWYGKTVASGRLQDRVTEDELRMLEFTPHQNEYLELMFPIAEKIRDELIQRPLCLVTIDRPLFLIGDEMVVLNTPGDPVHHLPGCAMTEEEFKRKLEGAAPRRKGHKRREVRRIVHVYTTQPRSIETALEIAMPISPRTLLLFGPVSEWEGGVSRELVTGRAADELSAMINENILRHSLDVIVGRVDDETFCELPIPERSPLMAVCGSSGAAQEALMATPSRLRPRRLTRPGEAS